MANFETRLARIEAQVGLKIKPNERDPELVEFIRILAGQDVPLDLIPCGVSGKKIIKQILAEAQGTSLPIMPQ